jgi:MoxR-like ATPase
MIDSVNDIAAGFERLGYVADRALATALFLLMKLRKPILIEGPAGVGKTEVAKVLSRLLNTDLIRLQCYQKQLLAIKIHDSAPESTEEKEKHIFGSDFLLSRPLLKSITAEQSSPVLLVDEVDRADEAFEAFLLELLSDFQISIPEMGTIKAKHIPHVVLTSNRTRELSDALKRRCLYHWIPYPTVEKEIRIVRAKLPGIEELLSVQVVRFVQAIRQKRLHKLPGVVETLDCAAALVSLGKDKLNPEAVEETLGCVLKTAEDMDRIRSEGIESILSQAL